MWEVTLVRFWHYAAHLCILLVPGPGGGGAVPEFELYLANLTLVPTLSSMVWVIYLVTLLPLSFLPRSEGDMVHLRIFHCYSD